MTFENLSSMLLFREIQFRKIDILMFYNVFSANLVGIRLNVQ